MLHLESIVTICVKVLDSEENKHTMQKQYLPLNIELHFCLYPFLWKEFCAFSLISDQALCFEYFLLQTLNSFRYVQRYILKSNSMIFNSLFRHPLCFSPLHWRLLWCLKLEMLDLIKLFKVTDFLWCYQPVRQCLNVDEQNMILVWDASVC